MQKVLPLEGVTVLSLEHAIAAPFCSRQLADLGATVIKVERPGVGDFARGYDTRVRGMSSHFVWTNRSKESLTLDLKNEQGLAVLKRLLPEVDVLIQNLAPGAAERLGLSYQELHSQYPRLIVCDISGYGQGGPFEQKKAYDLLIQSESGFLSVTGTPEEMVKAGCSIADISAGMYAYSNILSALLLREKTGEGSHIDISMLESMVEWMGFPLYYAFEEATPPGRSGASHASIYPYGPFSVKDNKTVMLGLQNEREWKSFCETVLQNAELSDNPLYISNSLRHQNRQSLRTLIEEVFANLSQEEVIARLEEAGIANANVNDMQGVWNHAQLQARNRWVTVESPVGEIPALLPPGQNNQFTPQMGAVPALGEHTLAILKRLKFTEDEIQTMQMQGVI